MLWGWVEGQLGLVQRGAEAAVGVVGVVEVEVVEDILGCLVEFVGEDLVLAICDCGFGSKLLLLLLLLSLDSRMVSKKITQNPEVEEIYRNLPAALSIKNLTLNSIDGSWQPRMTKPIVEINGNKLKLN